MERLRHNWSVGDPLERSRSLQQLGGKHWIFSGSKGLKGNKVALTSERKLKDAVTGFETTSDRIIKVRFKSKPININVIQVYTPTAKAKKETVEAFTQN